MHRLEYSRFRYYHIDPDYLIPRGTRIVWKPLGDGPSRHLSIDIPNPRFPVEDAASVKRAAAAGEG